MASSSAAAAASSTTAMLLALGALLLAQPAFADPVGDLAADVDSFWLILGGAMVFFMHSGFALLETGSVSMRNTQNILFKNVIAPTVSVILYWFCGYSFAYGNGCMVAASCTGGGDICPAVGAYFIDVPALFDAQIMVCEAFPTGVAARNVGLYALKNDVAGGSLWQDEATPWSAQTCDFNTNEAAQDYLQTLVEAGAKLDEALCTATTGAYGEACEYSAGATAAANGFIGYDCYWFGLGDDFFAADDYMTSADESAYNGYSYAGWFFQWAFAATAGTIVSGAVAERINFLAFVIIAAMLTGFIYPVVSHWGWAGDGWATAWCGNIYTCGLFEVGVIDFAGSGIVHMCGGVAALVAAVLVGPRHGRFVKFYYTPDKTKPAQSDIVDNKTGGYKAVADCAAEGYVTNVPAQYRFFAKVADLPKQGPPIYVQGTAGPVEIKWVEVTQFFGPDGTENGQQDWKAVNANEQNMLEGGKSNMDVHWHTNTLPAQNATFCTFGCLILWFGWYGFNCASTLGLSGGYAQAAAKVAVTTSLSAGGGAVSAGLLCYILEGVQDLPTMSNGILAGLVGITAPAATVEPWAAVVIGLVAGPIYYFAVKLLEKLHIDDVVSAIPVHLFCGMWGVIACGLFAHQGDYGYAYSTPACEYASLDSAGERILNGAGDVVYSSCAPSDYGLNDDGIVALQEMMNTWDEKFAMVASAGPSLTPSEAVEYFGDDIPTAGFCTGACAPDAAFGSTNCAGFADQPACDAEVYDYSATTADVAALGAKMAWLEDADQAAAKGAYAYGAQKCKWTGTACVKDMLKLWEFPMLPATFVNTGTIAAPAAEAVMPIAGATDYGALAILVEAKWKADHMPCGIFYGCAAGGNQLAAQLVFVLAILAWVGGMTALVTLPLKIMGVLTYTPEQQMTGMDALKHGGPSEPEVMNQEIIESLIAELAMAPPPAFRRNPRTSVVGQKVGAPLPAAGQPADPLSMLERPASSGLTSA